MATNPTRSAYKGRIVTMSGKVLDDGRLFVEGDRIAAIRAPGEAAPSGWSSVSAIDTGGTIYPGLIDLHGHLPYNILPPWQVPERFENRNKWLRSSAQYKRDIRGPMETLLSRAGTPRAIVRYVEVKLLLGGTTVAQGLKAQSGPGSSFYKGLVRNVEVPDETGLLSARTRVPDLRQDLVAAMKEGLDHGDPYLFHLAEGVDDGATEQFRLLKREGLLRRNLVCIHCLGLSPTDHATMRSEGVHTVWSPLSNLLLYGKTLGAQELPGAFALGCDWAPSGSRNLLHEIKVAHLHARAQGWDLSAERLALSVTVDAAAALSWGDRLGRLADGMLADLLVLDSRDADPFDNLLRATERDIRLVLIDGMARYGEIALMKSTHDAQSLEPLSVGGRRKALFLSEPDSSLGITLKQAVDHLNQAMADLTTPPTPLRVATGGRDAERDDFAVELDMQGDADPDDEGLRAALAALPPLTSVTLDPLTVIDDPAYFEGLDRQINLPGYLKGAEGLRQFYPHA